MQLGIRATTASKCIHECVYTICKYLYPTYLRLPTPIKARINMEKWKQQMGGFPGIYRAIDGLHIAAKKPLLHGQNYFNRKSYYSINMQSSNTKSEATLIEALIDYKKQFLDLEIGWPGSVGDSRLFQNSSLNQRYEKELRELGTMLMAMGNNVEEDIPAFILGDSAYRNSRHLVTTSIGI
jgi:DDE superfamily endonuclease